MRHNTILIIEDDCTTMHSLREILSGAGYDVVCASNAIEALQSLNDPAYPSWVLIDYAIEGLDARKYIKRIRQSYPSAKVYLASGYSEDKIIREEGLIEGIDKFIEKPFNPALLIEEMRRG